MSAPFGIRGIVEGFYGPPWSWADRLRAVEFLGEHGGNTYVYAPKNDPLHRDRWREPYLPEEWDRFSELVDACHEAGVTFWFGLSPIGPVNDAGMRDDPHLGPLRGRDPELGASASGILSNVALQPEASLIAVATLLAYAHDPGGYVPDEAWGRPCSR